MEKLRRELDVLQTKVLEERERWLSNTYIYNALILVQSQLDFCLSLLVLLLELEANWLD